MHRRALFVATRLHQQTDLAARLGCRLVAEGREAGAVAVDQTGRSSSRGLPQWRVTDKLFVWERPLRRADLEALGETAPDGEILGARVADPGVKDALIADDPEVYFTTPHFDGYPAILVRLERIAVPELEELITEAWLTRAPRRLADDYLQRRAGR